MKLLTYLCSLVGNPFWIYNQFLQYFMLACCSVRLDEHLNKLENDIMTPRCNWL